MDTLRDVKDKVRTLVGDPDGDWTTDAYLLSFINLVYEGATNKLSETCSPYITEQRDAPNLIAGTTDLSELQNSKDGTLHGLITPHYIMWKMAGQPDNWYKEAIEKDILPKVVPGAVNSSLYWEWRAFVIYLTPMNFPIDIQVRGEFKPPRLTKDEDRILIHPSMAGTLALLTAGACGAERGNAPYAQGYTASGQLGLADIANQLVRQQQGTTVRLGRANSRYRRRR